VATAERLRDNGDAAMCWVGKMGRVSERELGLHLVPN
jgi:hypothetical protein